MLSYCVAVRSLSCVRLCDPVDCSTPAFPFFQYLSEFAQTHVHGVSDAMQPSHRPHPLLLLHLSQPQGLFKRVSSLHQVAKVLEFQLQHQSFQWVFRTDLLWDELAGSPCSPRDSQESSPVPQLKSFNSLALSLVYGPTLTSILDYWKNMSCGQHHHFSAKVKRAPLHMCQENMAAPLRIQSPGTQKWLYLPTKKH